MADRDPSRERAQPSPRRLKAAGIVSALVGAFLLILMGTIAWRMAPMLLAAPDPAADGSRFAASRSGAMAVLGLFASVLLFAAISVVLGIRQALTGTRSWPLLYLLWTAGGLILAMTFVTVITLKAQG